MSILDYFQGVKKRKIRETIQAFDQFLTYAENPQLSPKQAKKNLEEGIVEIGWRHKNNNFSQGLLITKNGYFLSCNTPKREISQKYHNIRYNGKSFPIEKIFVRENKTGLFLAKANIKSPLSPMQYSFYDSIVGSNTPINVITKKNNEIKNYGGSSGLELEKKDLLNIHLSREVEIDGGIILDLNNNILGIHTNEIDYTKTDVDGFQMPKFQGDLSSIVKDIKKMKKLVSSIKIHYIPLCVKSSRILDLIRFAKQSLERKLR